MIDVPYAVKRALKDGNRPKQYRFQVLNDDETVDFVIDNDTLVKESVKIDERMCSGDRLKFGLCEGSSLEFQYFNHPNIRGRRVKVFLDVAYDNEGTEAYYPLSMGYFDVDQCSTQFSTGIIKVVAYNKLRSEYLNQTANDLLTEAYNSLLYDAYPTLDDVLRQALNGFAIEEYYVINANCDLTSLSTWEYTWETTWGVIRKRWAARYTFVAADTVNAYSQNSYYYGDGGARFVVSGLNAIKEYLLEHFITSSAEKAYYYINVGFLGENGSTSYRQQLFDVDGDTFTTPYIKHPRLNLTASSPSEIGLLWLHICVPDDAQELVDLMAALNVKIEYTPPTAMGNFQVDPTTFESWQNVSFRELQSAVFETSALYGQLDRDTDLFYGVELNSGSLTPSASLYPSATLYPNNEHGNNIFRPFPSEYQKLWTDSVGEQTFRYLIITYKAIEYDQQGNPTEVDKTLQRTVHEHGTTNYNCSDNWLFRNLVWTAEQVGAYADAMVEKMLNIRWFPFEMWSTGLPYVEVGDAIEIADKEGDTHISYVLQRQLNGIQNLQDTYINGQLDIF